METETSPPLARMVLMTDCTAVSEETAAVPPQVGEQPPPLGARTKASWKALRPVSSMMAAGSGGSLSSGMRYGAAPYQRLSRAVVAPEAWPATRAVVPAAVSMTPVAAPRHARRRFTVCLL